MCSGSNVHYKGKKNISISYKMAFDMDKDALFLSYSVFFFLLFLSVEKINTNHPHSTPDGEISQVNCLFVWYVWCEVWLMAGTFPLHRNLRKQD